MLSFCDHWSSGSSLEEHLRDITPLSPQPSRELHSQPQKRQQPKEKWEGIPLTWIPLLPPIREGTEVGPSCEQESPRPAMIYHLPVLAPVQVIHPLSSEKGRVGGTPEKQKININIYFWPWGFKILN